MKSLSDVGGGRFPCCACRLSGYIEAKMADDLFVNPGPDNPYLKPPKGGGECSAR